MTITCACEDMNITQGNGFRFLLNIYSMTEGQRAKEWFHSSKPKFGSGEHMLHTIVLFIIVIVAVTTTKNAQHTTHRAQHTALELYRFHGSIKISTLL